MEFAKADIDLVRKLLENVSGNQYKLGELADKIETKYGEGTLSQFAKALDVDVDYSTLKGYRYVWRKWKDSPTKPRNFSVAKALANYKDKVEYIEQRPNATEKEAREDVARLNREAKERAGPVKGHNLPNPAALMADMQTKIEKWAGALEIFSNNKDAITGLTAADIVSILHALATMLLIYEDRLKATTNFKESAEPEAVHEHEIIVPPPRKRSGHHAG